MTENPHTELNLARKHPITSSPRASENLRPQTSTTTSTELSLLGFEADCPRF